MQLLKQFITSGKTASECGISKREVDVLRGYKTVTVGGKTYETSEILNRVHSCDDCNKLKLKIKALELQLEKYAAPPVEPVQTILEDFFKSNYVRVGSLGYIYIYKVYRIYICNESTMLNCLYKFTI